MLPLTGAYKRAGIAKHSITYQFKRVTLYKFTQVDSLPQMLLYIRHVLEICH